MRGLSAGCLALLLVAVVLPAMPDGQTPDAGVISGHVRLGRVRGTPLPSNAYSPRAVGSLETGAASPEIRNVVVYLKDVAYHGPLATSRQQIVQEHETFVPRVLVVTRGSTVEFPNGDPIFHNVFSLSSAATFDLGRYPKGQTRSREFSKPGLVKVFCQIHSHMSASILVLAHPYFTIPDGPDGSFTLPNIPPGTYTLVGWHERVGERAATVRVQSGQTTSVEIALPVEDRP